MAKKCPKCKSDNPGTATFCADCGTQLPSLEDIAVTETIEAPKKELTRGTTFAGRYEIIEELGKGGMGKVYRVEDTKAKEEIALKLIKPEIAADKKTIERFRKELTTARKIAHRNVCRMFDLGEEKGQHYITMEYVPGEDLKSLIRRVKVDIGTSIKIAKQVCEGLAEAHRLGVVHRDLKPSNVMIDKEGSARIMDFGIARTIKERGITGSGVMIGTPEYMSPEQVEAKEIDKRSDIYSLGVIIYEMTTGSLPFGGETPLSVAMKQKSEIPKSPKELNSQIPDDLSAVILRCLEKEKENRYQNASEVGSELEKIKQGLPTSSRVIPDRKPITSKEITVRFRLKKLLIPTLAFIALLAVIGYFIFRGDHKLLEIKVGRTQQITHASGLEIDPAISPNGKMLAYAAGLENQMHLCIRQTAGGREIALTEDFPGNHRWPQWSPDGTHIAFQSEKAIFVVPALGGIPRRVVDMSSIEWRNPMAISPCPAWSPDGKQIAYAQRDDIVILSIDLDEPRKIAETFSPHSLCWAPDGKHIAFVSGNPMYIFGKPIIGNIAPCAIWVVSTVKGTLIQVTDNKYLNVSPVWTPDGRHLLFVSNRGGSRDVYQLPISASATPSGPPVRLTTGLNAHTISLSADGKKLSYSVFTYTANIWSIKIPKEEPVGISEALPITTGNQAIEGIDISSDSQWIAFDSNLSGNQDIYKMPIIGGEFEQLTTHPSDDFIPSWSPDGKEIAFYSFRKGNRDIYLMKSDGGSIQQLTDDPAQERYPDWSPDGNQLVFFSDKTGSQELYVIARENKDSKWGIPWQLTFDKGHRGRWSPDGRLIAYISGNSVRVISPDGGDSQVLVSSRDPAILPVPQFLEWSQNGKEIYYKAIDANGCSSFWSVPVTGGKPKLLVRFDDSPRKSNRPEFATDGFFFYFTLTESQCDLWVMDLLTNNQAEHE